MKTELPAHVAQIAHVYANRAIAIAKVSTVTERNTSNMRSSSSHRGHPSGSLIIIM